MILTRPTPVWCGPLFISTPTMFDPVVWAWLPPVEKYEPPAPLVAPAAVAGPIFPGVQREGHTCGYHALASVYAAYGIDPEKARLRFRLGVDRVAVPLADGTEGTLHPDLLRVLVQDGFIYQIVDLEDTSPLDQIRQHLGDGFHAVTLISRQGTGNLHWVVLGAVEGDVVTVVDSLAPEPYTRELAVFLSGRVVSAILVKPEASDTSAFTPDAHAQGIAEMAAVRRRLAGRSERSP